MDSLDNLYQILITDTFPGLTQKVIPEYSKLLKGLGKHLSAHEFYWEKDCQIYIRFYSNTKGNVDIFMYQFIRFSIAPEAEEKFKYLVQTYFLENKFNLEQTASTSFSLGGCNSFRAPKEESETKN